MADSFQTQETQQRFAALASLFKATGSQIGASGYPVLGSVLFMNAEPLASEASQAADANPMLALFLDLVVNMALQITAGQEMPDAMRQEFTGDPLFPGAKNEWPGE